MSDDSETVEDTEKGSLAEVTDDSCTVEFIEIVPLDRASNDYNTPGFTEVKPEDLQEIKQEPADETDRDGDPSYSVKQEPTDKYAPCFITEVSSMTDDSCTVEFIEIVPLDRASDNYNTPGFTEVKPEDLQEIKQKPADEYAPCFTTEVSSIIFS